jgi:hypothetical protein
MRFDARHIGSGVWGVWDGGVEGWRGTNLPENEAKQKAADMNVMFDQYGNRDEQERRPVQPSILVEAATWPPAGELDYWVRDRFEWWGRIQGPAWSSFARGHPSMAVWLTVSPCGPCNSLGAIWGPGPAQRDCCGRAPSPWAARACAYVPR